MRAIPVSCLSYSTLALRSTLVAAAVALMLCAPMPGQEAAQPAAVRPLITQAVDEARLTTLTGNTHPLARPEFDLGTAPASLPMQRMLLVLKRSADQEAAVRKLLDDQQDKASPNYHRWLTPEQYGMQFGPTDADLQTITVWLQSHGFQVGATKGRTVLEFSGTAGQVQEAFHTAIHKYLVNGEQHWANASDPQIPTALTPAVAGIDSLHNFPRRGMNHFVGTYSEKTKSLTVPAPSYTIGCGGGLTCYAVAPYDFATIYDVLPLWSAAPAINGTGETIAIVGRTNINPNDPTTFWSLFGLTVPANKLNIILNGPDPGINGDEGEADIDIQWSGAVAPQATVDFVTSMSTATTDGVDLSAVYIVENNLAPVMSESYGQCELGLGTAGNQFYYSLWEQAATQGISVFVSSGDNGSAGCDSPGAPARYGLNVNGIASTPFNAAIGGTDFNQYNSQATYWNPSNGANQESAKGYIAEVAWNDSCTNPWALTAGLGSTAEQVCNNANLNPFFLNSEGGSGGPSNCVVSTQGGSCTQKYPKPSWQMGTNVPNDSSRDLPDVSLFASNGDLTLSFYVICQSDQTGVCSLNALAGYGGTSVASPAFAGIMSLVNQKMGVPQGVPGFALYQLASKQANAFHDVPSGSTIAMPCITSTPNCTTKTSGDSYGVLSGYSTGTGYDLATGLGSVDATNLVDNWSKATFTATTTTLSLSTGSGVTHGKAVPVTIDISPSVAKGAASLLVSNQTGTTIGQAIDFFTLSGGSFSGNTSLLPAGTYDVIAHYGGDGTYGGSYSSTVSVIVSKENSTVNLPGLQLNGTAVTTVKYDDPYTLTAAVENAGGKLCNPPPYGQIVCPTGTISLTDNNVSLGNGTYTLDSTGSIQTTTAAFVLPTGTHPLTAQYNGDTNYNAGTASVAITVTPAATSLSTLYVNNASVGQSAAINVSVNTTSYGAAPGGTVTFYANGKAITGTVSYNPQNGGPGYDASLNVWLYSDTSAFPTPGNYTITATYSGDANYTGSTSSATTITVLYPIPSLTITPQSQTVNYGGTATLTALVSGGNKSSYPTGTITFTNNGTGATLSGPTTCAKATDSSGNYACQASASYTVTDGYGVLANYSGDNNYPSSNNYAAVIMPDFYLNNPGGITLTAGQSQSVTIGLGSQNGFAGVVSNFVCSGLPAETTCTFNPPQVTAAVNASNTTTLTITTTAIGQSRNRLRAGGLSAGWLPLAGLLFIGACFIGLSNPRKRGIPVVLLLLAIALTLPSCGGGGGGGVGVGQNNPVPSITSLSPAQVAAGSQINGQSVTVNGTNFMTNSAVTLGGVPVTAYANSATQIAFAPSTSQLATVAQLPVVVTNPAPGGGPSNAVNFVVTTGTPTGNFSITFTASSGGLTHSQTFQLVVQ
jgi:Pro-kumamolisin, activation domain/Bacterial Ig-like domain (group 3)